MGGLSASGYSAGGRSVGGLSASGYSAGGRGAGGRSAGGLSAGGHSAGSRSAGVRSVGGSAWLPTLRGVQPRLNNSRTRDMTEQETTVAAAALREAMRELADDAEGREELAAFALALREEGGSVKAALKRPRPERVMVHVILSDHDPMRVDSRDTLARRLGGEALSGALFRLTKGVAHQVFTVLLWVVLL